MGTMGIDPTGYSVGLDMPVHVATDAQDTGAAQGTAEVVGTDVSDTIVQITEAVRMEVCTDKELGMAEVVGTVG